MNSYLTMLQKDEYPERKIYCFDTLAASLGQGLMVYHLAKKRDEGLSIEEANKWLEENVLNFAHWFTVEDLMFLERGGRVTKTMAIAGTILNIKPVLHVDDLGRLVPVSKVRGRKKSLTALVDNMEETAINPSEQIVFIGHGDCIEDAEFVRNQIIERMGVKEFVIHYLHPVIGAHSGPGTVALFFIGTHR
jgi:DegV family protein with EDD domain